MAMYHLWNVKRIDLTINVKDEDTGKLKGMYVPGRAHFALKEDDYQSTEVQALLRNGILRLEKVT